MGASTPESEENCAMMAAKQLDDFLERGIIKNSVNFPECNLVRSGNTRIISAHNNVPNMVGQITSVLAKFKINIADMLTHHKGEIGYNLIDVESEVTDEVIKSLKQIEGVRMVRIVGQ